jgi:hypothetical protein
MDRVRQWWRKLFVALGALFWLEALLATPSFVFDHWSWLTSGAGRLLLIIIGLALVIVAEWAAIQRMTLRLTGGTRATPEAEAAASPPRQPVSSFEVWTDHEQIAPSPEPRHRAYLRVTNHGEAAPFYAQVTNVSGSVTRPSVPWPIKWRESNERAITVHHDSSELLEVLEVISMGYDPQTHFEPGVMIGKSLTEEIPMRIAATDTEDIYRAELRRDLYVVNTTTQERSNYIFRAGIDRTLELSPRLMLVDAVEDS